jgi:ATP-dependent DNA helicase RecQ
MSCNLHEALYRYFNFTAFRPGQKEVIERVMAGVDVLAVMPTGQGKSLCYQLPALILPGLSLIISPLVALMKDQVDNLLEKNLDQVTLINNQIPLAEHRRRIEGIRQGRYKLVYIAPERLRNRHFAAEINEMQVDLLVVDEAHCISQWGHDFRPDYLYIREFSQGLSVRPRHLALTATATPAVQQDILRQLGIAGAEKIAVSSDRPNLFISVQQVSNDKEKLDLLGGVLAQTNGSSIIYAATRKGSEMVAGWAKSSLGVEAECYHAGLEPAERTRIQEAFITGKIRLVAATNAFGMGIDKPDIRLVAHFNFPSSLEAYYQEIGRAGRDGLPALCLLFFSLADKSLQEWMINKDAVTREDLAVFWRTCVKFADGNQTAVPAEVLEQQGLDEIKQRLVISMLERIRALRLVEREPERIILKTGPERPRPEAVREMLQDAEKRLIYRKKKLETLINWAHTTSCRRLVLLEYFGEKPAGGAGDCCDNCVKKARGSVLYSKEPLTVLRCLAELPRNVGRKKLADILKGSRSVEITTYRYHKLQSYGKLAGKKGNTVLQMIDQLLGDGYLESTGADYPVLFLTSAGREALKSGKPLPVYSLQEKQNILPSVPAGETEETKKEIPEALLAALKEYRSNLAKQKKMPPFFFFHDSVIKEIARCRPLTVTELKRIKGLGEKKIGAYGDEIIKIVDAFLKDKES